MRIRAFGAVTGGCAATHASVALAGMPTPQLSDFAAVRIEAISFVGVLLLISAAVVRWLWNSLAKDFPTLPRLDYFRALSAVLLWGLLFVIVLTMIAGARELMTPGAWEKDGLLYKVAGDGHTTTETTSNDLDRRTARLRELQLRLWEYAARHDGRFPDSLDDLPTSAEIAEVDPQVGPYGYFGGLNIADDVSLLAFESNAVGETRLALDTSGRITILSDDDIRDAVDGEVQP
jgi:hypothetical protein